MSNQCCPTKSLCIEPANPIQNFSAEAPDQIEFISVNTGWDQGIGGYNTPPVGGEWQSDGCQFTCVSTTSQADADACAAAQQINCSVNDGGWKSPPNQDPVNTNKCNDPQTCASFCPDGIPFNFTIPAGAICETNKAYANQIAGSLACDGARQRKICLSGLRPTEICVNSKYTGTITCSGGLTSATSNTWALVGGALPDGLQFAGSILGQNLSVTGRSLTITGTTTASGLFGFTIRITAPNGDFMQKQYTICVVDITQSSLPDATIGTPYITQLTATPCANQQQSWQVISGSLPAGLTLNEQTGIISGTPTGPTGQTLFRVQFQDAAT